MNVIVALKAIPCLLKNSEHERRNAEWLSPGEIVTVSFLKCTKQYLRADDLRLCCLGLLCIVIKTLSISQSAALWL